MGPPGFHILVEGDHVRPGPGPRQNFHRPSIDALVRSAAAAKGESVVGLVLSGTLDDGAEGLKLIKQAGGVAIVQDPDDALYTDMPSNAIRAASPHYVLPINEMPKLLSELVRGDQPSMQPREQPRMDPLAARQLPKRLKELTRRRSRPNIPAEEGPDEDPLVLPDIQGATDLAATGIACPECGDP